MKFHYRSDSEKSNGRIFQKKKKIKKTYLWVILDLFSSFWDKFEFLSNILFYQLSLFLDEYHWARFQKTTNESFLRNAGFRHMDVHT